MNTEKIKEILAWVKTTDLTSVALKEKDSGFSFATSEHADQSFADMPPAHYQAVSAPAIGTFHWSRPGHPQKVEEGISLPAEETVGYIETLPGKTVPVKVSSSGKVARILVEDSSPVAYGQALIFIEPDGK
jgi:acetyl-CoA carboxylase biotin carboxyl carrier protein